MRRLPVFPLLLLPFVLAACDPPAAGPDGGQPDGAADPCTGDETRCLGALYQTCDVSGVFHDQATCALPSVCVEDLGCSVCNPALASFCDGDVVFTCNGDGTRGEQLEQCAQGYCAAGMCTDPCEDAAIKRSYIGCEYWPVDLDNGIQIDGLSGSSGCGGGDVDRLMNVCQATPLGGLQLCNYDGSCFNGGTCILASVCVLDAQHSPFAVVVANPDPVLPVQVTMENAAGFSATTMVAPGEVAPMFPLALGFADQSTDYSGIQPTAYKITAERPIIAYQFNPLDNVDVFSNDASLLIPGPAFDTRYYAISYPTLTVEPSSHDWNGYVAVVASAPGSTQVTFTASAGVREGTMVAAMAPGETQTFTLSQFDVLNLEAVADGDLSGSLIECAPACGAYVGHEAAFIFHGNCCADHLEDSLFPTSTWGKQFVIARSQPRGAGESDVIRVIAQKPNTMVTFNPAPTGECPMLQPGEWCEVRIGSDTEILGSEPILVGHYLVSTGNQADPSLAFDVPVEQFRQSYSFLIPAEYEKNFIALAAPAGALVVLDGLPVQASLTVFGAGTYAAGRRSVDVGQHKLECPMGCGVLVMGYSDDVSYMFSAGLDLEQIVVN